MKKQENIEFSIRLNACLDQAGFPAKGYGRQVKLGDYFGIKQRGARKWLEGEGMPRTTRLKKMIRLLEEHGVYVSVEWLMTGAKELEPHWYRKLLANGVATENENYLSNLIPTSFDLDKNVVYFPCYFSSTLGTFLSSNTESSKEASNMGILLEDLKFDTNNCFAINIDNDRYAASLRKGVRVIVKTDIAPSDGNIVLLRYQKDNHLTFALYQSPTRFEIIGKSSTELREYDDGEVVVEGVAVYVSLGGYDPRTETPS